MLSRIAALPSEIKQYLLITTNYWFFTLTDGALRMLVVLYFHQLGYQPLAIAMLFLFYEFFGVVTNLVGGWLGARIGLNKTMNIGLFMQVGALLMLTVPSEYLTVIWVMAAQALSGIAKDLNKMSAKSSIKSLVKKGDNSTLFKWVALLTGSKNTLKGLGYFLGGVLLTFIGFKASLWLMAIVLLVMALISVMLLKADLGKAKNKPKFSQIFSTNANLNYLSAARLALFASRDVWMVIALPVYLSAQLNWPHSYVGGFIALWIICYGMVQAFTPKLTPWLGEYYQQKTGQALTTSQLLFYVGLALTLSVLALALLLNSSLSLSIVISVGLFVFGAIFAVNSSLHSFAIVAIAKDENTSMDVGFYYMANAMGRLLGTVLSGFVYQLYGLQACLYCSAVLALLAAVFIRKIKV